MIPPPNFEVFAVDILASFFGSLLIVDTVKHDRRPCDVRAFVKEIDAICGHDGRSLCYRRERYSVSQSTGAWRRAAAGDDFHLGRLIRITSLAPAIVSFPSPNFVGSLTTEFFWTFGQAPLPRQLFRICRRRIGEFVDRLSGHLCGRLFGLQGDGNEPPDRLGTRGPIVLPLRPCIKVSHLIRVEANHHAFAPSGGLRAAAPLFWDIPN